MIVERYSTRVSVYTLPGDPGWGTLPVFSHDGEARSFLRAGGLGGSWRTRETSGGELASLLLGPCAGVPRVTLDPLTGRDAEPLAHLVNVDRRVLVDCLTQSPRAVAKTDTNR